MFDELNESGITIPKISRLCRMITESGSYKGPGSYKLASGRTSPYYFDLRRLLGYPQALEFVSELIYEKILETRQPGSVGGVESASIPLAAAVSLHSRRMHAESGSYPELTSFYVRKSPKKHGTGSMIEGVVRGGCVVVDDVITSGGSILRAVDLVRKEGHECNLAGCILFRGSDADRRTIGLGVPLAPLVTINKFLLETASR